ncbi:MAG: T9SS type A sorting domain-containing protein, partial [Bacteroidetes bacterium]|nr:T9SS type A sorting domain-containing protein [Bacteroidota bacterium]
YDAFQILFNRSINTLADALRCSRNSFELCPSQNYADYKITGKPPKLYDRPIAVLLGPTCVSNGDLTAQRLRYHPMVKFFGASSNASLGFNTFITDFSGWFLRYSIADAYHVNNPGIYLNRREFPIDFPVWHNRDDVAAGKDAVVEKALDWINNLIYGHDLKVNKSYYHPENDTLKVSVQIENPNLHQTSSTLYINNSEGNLVDSLILNRIGISGKSETWKGNLLVQGSEDFFSLSLSAKDITDEKVFTSSYISRFTTSGPVTVDSIVSIKSSNNYISIRPFFYNHGIKKTIKNVTVKLSSKDPWVNLINPSEIIINDIVPDSMVGSSTWSCAGLVDSFFPGYINLSFEIMSDGWVNWTDSIRVIIEPVGINEEKNLPITFKLEQNYPNPFNPETTITYSIGKSGMVDLSIYNILGIKIKTLLNKYLSVGTYKINLDGTLLSSGIYFCKLQTENNMKVIKIELLK